MNNAMVTDSNVERLNICKSIDINEQFIQVNQIYSALGDLLKDFSNCTTKIGRTIMFNAIDTTFKQLGELIANVNHDSLQIQTTLNEILEVARENDNDLSAISFVDEK